LNTKSRSAKAAAALNGEELRLQRKVGVIGVASRLSRGRCAQPYSRTASTAGLGSVGAV